jgi:hypothetical protein
MLLRQKLKNKNFLTVGQLIVPSLDSAYVEIEY